MLEENEQRDQEGCLISAPANGMRVEADVARPRANHRSDFMLRHSQRLEYAGRLILISFANTIELKKMYTES